MIQQLNQQLSNTLPLVNRQRRPLHKIMPHQLNIEDSVQYFRTLVTSFLSDKAGVALVGPDDKFLFVEIGTGPRTPAFCRLFHVSAAYYLPGSPRLAEKSGALVTSWRQVAARKSFARSLAADGPIFLCVGRKELQPAALLTALNVDITIPG